MQVTEECPAALAESLDTSIPQLESRWQDVMENASTRDIEGDWDLIND